MHSKLSMGLISKLIKIKNCHNFIEYLAADGTSRSHTNAGMTCGKQIQPQVFQMVPVVWAHNFYFALIELKIWNYKAYRILVACVLDAFLILSFSRFLVVVFLEIQMLRLANFQNKLLFLYEMLFFSAKNLQLVQTVVFR